MALFNSRTFCKRIWNFNLVACHLLYNRPDQICLTLTLHMRKLEYNAALKREQKSFSDLFLPNYLSVRYLTPHHINRPDPHEYNREKRNLNFKVIYPADGAYTIKKLPMIKLGGRDPETGRVIYGCVGGGHKRKYRWVQMHRVPEDHDSDTLVEKVINIQYDPNRTSRIALVGQSTKLRYIIATSTMKAGDYITSTRVLPPMPIRPKEGDAHPIGALPLKTVVCCLERYPGGGASEMINAGCSATISKKVNDQLRVKYHDGRELVFDPQCIVVVGRVEGAKKPIGSGWRLRWLGRRPRSGLWQRKTGRHGRKIHPFKPLFYEPPKPKPEFIYLTAPGQGPARKIIPATLRVS